MRPADLLDSRSGTEHTNLGAEEQLILCASRVAVTEDERRHIVDLVRAPLDWDYLVTVATRHAVAPLLHHGLETALGPGTAEAEGETEAERTLRTARDELGKLRSAAGARVDHVYAQLSTIAASFGDAGVETIALKDLTLAREVYPDPSLRPIGDIDLLVRHEHYERAGECLVELGFAPVLEGAGRYARKYSVGRHFRRAADELWVDLQWNVAQREWDLHGDGAFTYDVERMWRRARRLELGTEHGSCVLAPSDEDMLFHLCLHAEGHTFGELILLCDIAELLRTRATSLDWDELLDLTRSHGASSPVYYTLHLTERLLGVGAPDQMLAELEPAYFQGSLFGPLFSNLGPLHESLDHIDRAAKPPEQAMARFETLVRSQAVQAMRVAAELDGVASSFRAQGGHLIAFAAERSPRVFPDDQLAPFGAIEAVVLDTDADLMGDVLRTLGYEHLGPSAGLVKQCAISARDPALADQAVALAVHVDVVSDLGELTLPTAQSKSRRASETVSARLRRDSHRRAEPEARVTIRALAAEELLVWCIVSAASGKDRLFGLCGLVGPLQQLSSRVDWNRFGQVIRASGVDACATASLTHVGALLEADARSMFAERFSLADDTSEPRLFEWARYGSEEMQRHRDLRAPFFFLLALLSAQTAREKAGYVWRSFFRRPSDEASLPNLLLKTARGVLCAPSAARSGALDTVYWLGNRHG